MFDVLILMVHKQFYATVMLNNHHYSSENAVFDMSTVILLNTFKTEHHSLMLVSMKRCDSFCHSVIIAVFSNFMVLNFRP